MKWSNYEEIKVLLVVFVIMAISVRPAEADDFDRIQPIADAGLPRYAATEPIVFDGTGSYDPDNSGPLLYTWQQVAGPSLVITDPNTASPTISGFVQTDEVQECEFELVVSDGELTGLPDTVKVIIVPAFGASRLRQRNPQFDPDKPTIIFFGGGDCVTGGGSWGIPAWAEKANIISFLRYEPDKDAHQRTYYQCGDMIIVHLSNVAPDYKQPIQSIGYSTGGDPAIDVGIHLNRIYRDARYAVNRVTLLDAPCRWYEDWALPFKYAELFLTSAVDGEQCWIDEYYGLDAYGVPHRYFKWPDELVVSLGISHGAVRGWYEYSVTNNDMNNFNSGVVASAYWSVIGPGKNLQLAPQTDAYYFRWDGNTQSSVMSIFDEALHPGRLPEPVTLVVPENDSFADANGVILSCEVSENSIGYQLIFGQDPYHMTYLVSDTPNPPCDPITTFPFEQCWWTVRAYDEYGSTIHADPVCIKSESVIAQTIENATTKQTYASIQQAINDARPGDEIVVSPGIYQYLENINFKGKNLTVRSTDPNDPAVVAATVINGGHRRSVVTFSCGEQSSCVLAGFTITGGIVGISCCDASPTIKNCTVGSYGPIAIDYWENYEPTIIDCNILGQITQVVDPQLLLAAYWKLDETEGDTAYESATKRDGSLHGDPLWQPDVGKIDGAIDLDGIDDYISTPFVLNPALGPVSVFAWVKGGAPGQVIISQADGVDWLLVDATDGCLMTELRYIGGRTEQPQLVSSALITDGEWHRIGFVWDETSRILYVDDVEVAADTQPNDLGGSEGGMYIGAGNKLEVGTFCSGLIDDVRIYNSAVTP